MITTKDQTLSNNAVAKVEVPAQRQITGTVKIAEMLECLKTFNDRQVLRFMASELIRDRDPDSIAHLKNEDGKIKFKVVPPLLKVMTMPDAKLILTLSRCPCSNNYGLQADEIIERFQSVRRIRQAVIDMVVEWTTFRSLQDISEKSCEQSMASFEEGMQEEQEMNAYDNRVDQEFQNDDDDDQDNQLVGAAAYEDNEFDRRDQHDQGDSDDQREPDTIEEEKQEPHLDEEQERHGDVILLRQPDGSRQSMREEQKSAQPQSVKKSVLLLCREDLECVQGFTICSESNLQFLQKHGILQGLAQKKRSFNGPCDNLKIKAKIEDFDVNLLNDGSLDEMSDAESVKSDNAEGRQQKLAIFAPIKLKLGKA